MKRYQVLANRLAVSGKIFLKDDIIYGHELGGHNVDALLREHFLLFVDEAIIDQVVVKKDEKKSFPVGKKKLFGRKHLC